MKGKMIARIVVVISIVALFLLGAAPISVESTSQVESNINVLYMPLIMHSPFDVEVLYYNVLVPKYPPAYLVGEIVNNSNKTVYNVNITAKVFANEILTETYTSTTALLATFPGGTNPFMLGPSDLFWDYETVISIDGYEFENDPEYLPLTVLSKNFSGSTEAGYLTGEIRNDNLNTIERIKVVAGIPRDFPSTASTDTSTLAPGETTSYSAWLYHPGPVDGESYTVWAQGAVAP